MGHIAHLRKVRKQLKSINTFDYIIMLIKRRKNPLSTFWELMVLHLNKLESPSSPSCFVQNLVDIGSVVLEKKIFKFHSFFFRFFSIISPWKRAGPAFEQTWIPYTQRYIVQVWMKLAQWFWKRWKCDKFTTTTTTTTDNGKAHSTSTFGSGELKRCKKKGVTEVCGINQWPWIQKKPVKIKRVTGVSVGTFVAINGLKYK